MNFLWKAKWIVLLVILTVATLSVLISAMEKRSSILCPPGTEIRGHAPPMGLEQWCVTKDKYNIYVKYGPYVRSHNNGQKRCEGIYRNESRNGLRTCWYRNGKKLSEGYVKNEQKEGLWVRWYNNGQKLNEGKFKNGIPEGLWLSWQKNGQKENGIEYRNGHPYLISQ